jgi:hypothetical protein
MGAPAWRHPQRDVTPRSTRENPGDPVNLAPTPSIAPLASNARTTVLGREAASRWATHQPPGGTISDSADQAIAK